MLNQKYPLSSQRTQQSTACFVKSHIVEWSDGETKDRPIERKRGRRRKGRKKKMQKKKVVKREIGENMAELIC